MAATHWPGLSAKALSFDDQQYLTRNVLVQNPGWASAKRFLTEVLEPSTVQGYYQPLAMISLMLDYAAGGRENNLRPFHITSLALHTANTALIIVLLYLLFDNIWAAAAVGLLFGVHPMTVEPIPWVGERKTLLAAFFALWSLIFLRSLCADRPSEILRRLFFDVFAGVNVQTYSVPLPLVMLLMDYWPLKRLDIKTLLEKLPLFVLGIISAVITYISQHRTAATTLPTQFGPQYIPLVLCHNIIFYLYKIILPVNLVIALCLPKTFWVVEPDGFGGCHRDVCIDSTFDFFASLDACGADRLADFLCCDFPDDGGNRIHQCHSFGQIRVSAFYRPIDGSSVAFDMARQE